MGQFTRESGEKSALTLRLNDEVSKLFTKHMEFWA